MRKATLFLSTVLATTCLAPAASIARAFPSSDNATLGAAAARLHGGRPAAALRWLKRQGGVTSAAMGMDHRTIDVRFRDGVHAVILPALWTPVRLDVRHGVFRPNAVARAPGGRAAVWEPFATELGLGQHAGDIEVQQLQAAGFAVDQAYDTSVTVASMASLSSYGVVYMHTHSGLTGSGDGVLATGQLADNDPSVAPLLSDGSVIPVGVAGSNQTYYGITSHFITAHLNRFSASALLFLNGCSLLRAAPFWNALAGKGAGAMVSWDENAAAKDDYLSAAAFFNVMNTGQTVSGALSALKAAGYGTSSDNGIPATMGYVGDGSITLQRLGAAQPTPTPVLPTSTPQPTAVPPTSVPPTAVPPTSTPIPTSVPTSTPLPTHPPVPARIDLSALVKPGTAQVISVSQLTPGTAVQVRVAFPNGDVLQSHASSDASGNAQLTFVQPRGAITRTNRIATVTVTATTASGTATETERYTIGLGTIDVVAQPRTQRPGRPVTIYVHTAARTAVTVKIRFPSGKASSMRGKTGAAGWTHVVFTLKRSLRSGQQVSVRANARLHGKPVHAGTTVTAA